MNKKILLLAGTISALFAGKPTSTTPVALELEPVTGAVAIRVTADNTPAPAPTAPVGLPVGTHQVAVRARESGAADFARFAERPLRRKVKYGNNRWVLLG